MKPRLLLRISGLACLALASGCATVPYPYGTARTDLPDPLPLAEGEDQIVRGRPVRVLDASDWIWPGSWLGKLLLWDRRVDSHHIGPETEDALRRYLEANDLGHVKVRLNAYHVRDEWRRLRRNRAVGGGWRYTLGVLGWLQYTLLPGRFFGGDHYNPYSNTIHLYSDIPAVALHEGGHAKDFAGRRWKGLYAALYLLPGADLYHEAMASNDALGYLLAEESPGLQREGYRILHPAYGTYAGSAAAFWTRAPFLPVYAAGVLGGHATGRIRAASIPDTEAPGLPGSGEEPAEREVSP